VFSLSVKKQSQICDLNRQTVQSFFPADSPARRPLDQAHCRLYPPQSPSISRTSPQAYRPGTSRLSIVSGSNWLVNAPPAVVCASSKPSVPISGSSKCLTSPAAVRSCDADREDRCASMLMPARRTTVRPMVLCSAPANRYSARMSGNAFALSSRYVSSSAKSVSGRRSSTTTAPLLLKDAARDRSKTAGPLIP